MTRSFSLLGIFSQIGYVTNREMNPVDVCPIATPEFKAIVKVIKQHQQGHISKLQLKSEAELELLEALREYMQKRAELDTQYSKVRAGYFTVLIGFNLLWASAGTPSTPSSSTLPSQIEMCETDLSPSIRDSNSSRDTYQALSSLLLESEHQARCRMQASERFGTEIVDVIKEFNKDKSVTTKSTSITEADLAQKKYEDAAKRPKSGLQALKNLVTGKDAEERIIKLKSKWKTRARQLNNSRNQYLYLSKESTLCSHIITKFTYIESFISTSLKESSENVDKKISKINRQRDIEIFLKEYHQIFNEQAPFSFDAALTDEQKLDIKNAIALIKAQRIRINVQIQTLKELGVVPITPVASEEIPALPVSNNKSSPVTVIADFISIKPDEVSIFLGDAIEIVSPDTDGRTKVRVVASNTTGFVPTANISIKSSESSAQLLTDSSLAGMVCLCVGSSLKDETVAATTASKEKLMRRTSARRLTGHSIRPQAGDLSAGTEPKVLKARALYSYEATCDELSIDAGEILLIKSKETGSDAWWEGEGNMAVANFL
ncbi:hypothetical protein BSLG_003817 [Batrachochytrium salamandrivorans]|nr:hypothetical protein BSLG_003817 [Batrachochytrium salamandrivorans]